MDKNEYREEVLNQLIEQNNHLASIDDSLNSIQAMMFFVTLGVIALIIFAVFIDCHLGNIEHYLDIIRDSNDVLSPFYDLINKLDRLDMDLDSIFEKVVSIDSYLRIRR